MIEKHMPMSSWTDVMNETGFDIESTNTRWETESRNPEDGSYTREALEVGIKPILGHQDIIARKPT
jgi:hypothetical protein